MSLNRQLQQAFEHKFKPLGIVAYTNCCRIGCSKTYEDKDDEFELCKKGIYFICLPLNGRNYLIHKSNVHAHYNDFNYLMGNWDNQYKIIHDWCDILGLNESDYIVEKPDNNSKKIRICFATPLEFEMPSFWGESSESSEDDSEDDDTETLSISSLLTEKV